ncbi:MAG: PD40 domain-containing protein [Lewinellaceae bacterium]|nr:PD40 domain-containing protein [Lewinellaceae bacterium]
MRRYVFYLIALFAIIQSPLHAQYFGRNKPHYQDHDFKVSETEHFRIYEYLDNPDKLRELAAATELWYQMHQAVLQDTFTEKNPLLIYSNHAGFQQTNAIMGSVSVGTGGVTEGLRNRVVFPVAMTNQQTHHVLGHELVHAFQYHMLTSGDSTGLRSIANLPLWMVEGLAEYLSIGRIDAHTAMWMRDAVKNDALPKNFRDLDYGKFFPYRWGQAFWAYIAGVYGDEVIRPFFINTAKYGLDPAVRLTFNTTSDSLATAWTTTLKNHYGQWVTVSKKDKDDKKAKKENLPGKRLLSEENFGSMNISPAISQNGKYLIFLSEKNLFSLDLYLADARTGKILKKVASSTQDGHADQFDFIESAGTWAPDEKRFAFDVYEKGRSTLIIKEVFKGKTVDRISIPGVPEFNNPVWSPDGKTIVVSGLVNGQTDLYAYNLKTKKVRRLTNDRYSEILPSWSADGKYLAFSTDQVSQGRGRINGAWSMNLAVMNVETGEVEMLDIFPGADNMNPQFDEAGNLYFLSNRDGMRNMYYYDRTAKKVFQATTLETGISGITPYAPAIAVSGDRDRILYTYYNDGNYEIHQARASNFELKEVDPNAVDMVAASLPPFNPRQRDVVNTNLRMMDNALTTVAPQTSITPVKYKPEFSLSYIGGSAGVGVSTGNSSFGATTGLAGGIDMLFDDILGNNQLYAGIAINGEINDAAGQFTYLNQKNRINWGFNLSHIPYRSGGYYQDFTPGQEYSLDSSFAFVGYKDELIIQRLFQERVGTFAYFPLSVTKRFEVGLSYEFYHQRVDRYLYYYDVSGFYYGQERERIPAGGSLNLASVNAAYVGDNSYFGLTAPLAGWRYRIGVEQFFGAYTFRTLLLDGRKYFRLRPVTLAVRGLGYGRFGGNANSTDEVYPLFAGQPFFVRGYTNDVLYQDAPQLIDQMAGSKILVGNVELRLPFTGPKQLAVIPTKFLLTDLNLFFDAGLGWFIADDLKKQDENDPFAPVQHKPIMSAGISLRVNVFGALILEPYYALPLSVPKEQRSWVFGLNIVPGW